jgi:hypothetical protein
LQKAGAVSFSTTTRRIPYHIAIIVNRSTPRLLDKPSGIFATIGTYSPVLRKRVGKKKTTFLFFSAHFFLFEHAPKNHP